MSTATPYTTSHSSRALTETGPAHSGLPSWIGAGVTVSPVPPAIHGLWFIAFARRTRIAPYSFSHEPLRGQEKEKRENQKKKREKKKKQANKGETEDGKEERQYSPISIYSVPRPRLDIHNTSVQCSRCGQTGQPWSMKQKIWEYGQASGTFQVHSQSSTSWTRPLPEVPSGGKKGASVISGIRGSVHGLQQNSLNGSDAALPEGPTHGRPKMD
ncbi:hypothetical protein BDW75DRAFT_114275 [Aspergillus navahoensis]